MGKIRNGKDKQANLEDTLEFLSLDDETIESYGRKTNSARLNKRSLRGNRAADIDEADEYYEDEDYEDEEDVDYEDEDYEDEDEEDVDDEDEEYEDEEEEA